MKKFFNIAAFFAAGLLIAVLMVYNSQAKALPSPQPFDPSFFSWCLGVHGTMMHNAAGSAGCAQTNGFLIPQE